MEDNLFDMSLDTGMTFLDKKEGKKNDGILRISTKDIKDPKKGTRVVMRFLPNLTRDGKIGQVAIEKFIHYVNIPNHTDLNGYIDSMKNFPGEKCDLTDTFWLLKNSSSIIEVEKAALISRSVKYYSYVQIIDHETEPELNGKIMIFSYGVKIKDKINSERTGEITGTQVNVVDLANGKDFVCIVKEVAGFTNYESSQFRQATSSIQIPNKDGVLKEVPTTEVNGKKVIDPKYQDHIKEYLLGREVELENFAAVRWTEETRSKVSKIIAILTNTTSNSTKKDATFFEEEEEENIATSPKKKDDEDFFNF